MKRHSSSETDTQVLRAAQVCGPGVHTCQVQDFLIPRWHPLLLLAWEFDGAGAGYLCRMHPREAVRSQEAETHWDGQPRSPS